jgi:hypothetical protein
MMRMRGAPGPRRVDEGVVQFLLNLVDDPLLEVGCVIAEQANARCDLLDDLFVPSADCVFEIPTEKVHNPRVVGVWDAGLLESSPPLLTPTAVRHPLSDRDVP